jgi:hypothetical protein
MLLNQQHSNYLHYVLIPSEPEHFTFDKFIPEALPLLEAPPVARLVHLYKLLHGVSFARSSSSKVLPLIVSLREEKKQEILAWNRVSGVLLLTHLWNEVLGQHRLHNFAK